MKRRVFLCELTLTVYGPLFLRAAQTLSPALTPDPWSAAELLQPEQVAAMMKNHSHLAIISVVFPSLSKQRHIAGAVYAGPGSKPEGLDQLKTESAKLRKNQPVIIYCGCCPMDHCPNIRPAYRTLRDAGFLHVYVLNLPTNFRKDWVDKGYPVEPAVAGI